MGGKAKKKKVERARAKAAPIEEKAADTEPLRPVSSKPMLSRMVPVRFDPTVLEEVRRRAADDQRSVSAWIRRAVDRELQRSAE